MTGARPGRAAWIWAAPALFLFILPITHTTPLRLACLGLAMAAVAFTVWQGMRRPLPAKPLLVALGAWIVVCTAACLHSIEPAYSWGEFRNEVLVPMIAFAVFFWLSDGDLAWRRWRAVLLASCLVVTTIAIVSYRRDGDWLRASLVGDRNAFSTYVVLIVPFLLVSWMGALGRPLLRSLVALALLLALVSGAFTQNRNMWFGIAAECVTLAALVWLRATPALRRQLRKRYLVAGLLGTVLFCGTLAYVIQQKARVSNTSTEEQARFDRDPRFEIWVYAAERIRERPWFGHGYGRGILRSDFRTHFDNILKWHGHNLVIDYVMEAGVFGGVVIIGLFLALAVHAWRICRTTDGAVWLFGAWILAMLVGVAMKVMTDDILVRESSLLFWSAIGIAFGYASRGSTTAARIPEDRTR